MIADGRQVAVTIHRLKNLEENAENFTIDVQVYENGKLDFDNVLTTNYKKLRRVYESIKYEQPCDAVNEIINGWVEIEFNKGNCIRLKEREIWEVLAKCRQKV